MNLAYLEFIGAIHIDRSTPKDLHKEKEHITPYNYLDTKRIQYGIEDLEEALKIAKKEQKQAIKYLYNEIVKIVKNTDSQLRVGYISKKIEKISRPKFIVNDANVRDGTDEFAHGDIAFAEDEIVLFMNWFSMELMEELKKRYSKDINVYKGILSKDPIEIHIDMSWCLNE